MRLQTGSNPRSSRLFRIAGPAMREDTRALQALNDKVHRDARVDMVLLPFSDGVTLARKR